MWIQKGGSWQHIIFLLLSSTYSTVSYGPPIGWVQLLLEGVHARIFKENYSTSDFPGGPDPNFPLDPPMEKRGRLSEVGFLFKKILDKKLTL